MGFDAFTAGVKPGGLRSKSDIKLLICYLISSIKEGLSKEDIIKVLQENAFANYFESSSAFSELLENRNIISVDNSDKYIVTESGKLIATQLETSIPASIREQTVSSALNLMAKLKLERENVVECKETKFGYKVKCHISGGEEDLMSFSLQVPDTLQAELIEKNFYQNPALIYRSILAVVTRNKDFAKEVLEEILNMES